MPTYVYESCYRHPDHGDVLERNVAIDKRDEQTCTWCGTKLKRKMTFTGLTWAPTSTGGGHK